MFRLAAVFTRVGGSNLELSLTNQISSVGSFRFSPGHLSNAIKFERLARICCMRKVPGP